MKTQILALIATVLASQTQAAPVIPKLDLATCQISKADLAGWYPEWRNEPSALASVQDPMLLTVQQVNLVGRPGIADYFKVSIRGFDADGKLVKNSLRTLEQLAVNYAEDVISVGYTPYSVSATMSEPFSLLIEGKGTSATGHLAFTPLQSTSAQPMKQLELPCNMHKMPSEPVTISPEEVSVLDPAAQFELVYNLHRLNLGSYIARDQDSAAYGLTPELLAKVKSEIAQTLSARELPPVPTYEEVVKTTVTEGDRCGELTITGITAVYDRLTMQQIRSGDKAARARALGYTIGSASCKTDARVLEVKDTYRDGGVRVVTQNWSVRDIVISPTGLMGKHSFKPAQYNFW